MELYRVLLVDDEEDIRVGISRKMDWAGLGFSLVGEAENGRDALELAETAPARRGAHGYQDALHGRPGAVPHPDGAAAGRPSSWCSPALTTLNTPSRPSGMNVSEYILKPINAAELTGVLQKLRAQLDAERTERQNVETAAQPV